METVFQAKRVILCVLASRGKTSFQTVAAAFPYRHVKRSQRTSLASAAVVITIRAAVLALRVLQYFVLWVQDECRGKTPTSTLVDVACLQAEEEQRKKRKIASLKCILQDKCSAKQRKLSQRHRCKSSRTRRDS